MVVRRFSEDAAGQLYFHAYLGGGVALRPGELLIVADFRSIYFAEVSCVVWAGL